MTIVKINVHKISAHRSLDAKGGQVKINNNVSITNVENMRFDIPGRKGLKFTFAFNCSYEPDLGRTEVEGQVLYVEEEKKVSKVLDEWQKGKRVPLDVMEEIVNAALHKGNIQAIKISDDLNLPSPLPLPKVNRISEENDKSNKPASKK
ncbi:MAG TPA: hypothetical protein VJH68_05510 [Candidatus Nanoarchaeia archaeon]|nr:hypothetical protein [Candidatus Nanoarchaeia archaeon]